MAETRTHEPGAGLGGVSEPESQAADIVNREAQKEAQARFVTPSEQVAEEVSPGQARIPVTPRAEAPKAKRRTNIFRACKTAVARQPLLTIGAFIVAGIVFAAMKRR